LLEEPLLEEQGEPAMTLTSAAALCVLLASIEVLVGSLRFSPPSFERSVRAEVEADQAFWGTVATRRAVNRANAALGASIADNHAASLGHATSAIRVTSGFALTAAAGVQAIGDLALLALHAGIYRPLYRIYLGLPALAPGSLFLAAGFCDGLAARALKAYRFGRANPRAYKVACRLLALLIFVWVALIFLPLAVLPLSGITVAALAIIPVRVAAANL
jgi:hypothetical protein